MHSYKVGDDIRALRTGGGMILFMPLRVMAVREGEIQLDTADSNKDSHFVHASYWGHWVPVNEQGVGVVDDYTIIEPADPDFMPQVGPRAGYHEIHREPDEALDYDFTREPGEAHGNAY